MEKRAGLGKKIRFEVFKRDSFTCQYCGAKAPDVLLHVDHIIAVANGGTNEITNLITSCSACNSGKGARALSDQTVLQKQRRQLEELNERRQQLEMMAEWRKGLDELKTSKVNLIAQQISDKLQWAEGTTVSDYGRQQISKWLGEYSLEEVFAAIDISATQYLTYCEGVPEKDSQSKAFTYIPKICKMRRVEREKPHLRDALYVRGILRNRLSYVNERTVLDDLDYAFHVANVNPEYVKHLAKHANSWTKFNNELWETIHELEGEPKQSDER